MSRNLNEALVDNLAPIKSFSVVAAEDVGTTPVKMLSGNAGRGYHNRLIRVLNGSDTETVAWMLTKSGSSAPSFHASFTPGAGYLLLPGSETDLLCIPASYDVYVVSSDSGTSVSITVVER